MVWEDGGGDPASYPIDEDSNSDSPLCVCILTAQFDHLTFANFSQFILRNLDESSDLSDRSKSGMYCGGGRAEPGLAALGDVIPPQFAAEHFDKTFNTNACGTYFTVQKALPHLNDGASTDPTTMLFLSQICCIPNNVPALALIG